LIERKIQTEKYWRTEFSLTDQDMEELGLLFLEVERPLTVQELARLLITNRCQREETQIRRQLSQGAVYRPNGAFEVGENLVFPYLDFAVGTVVDQREGHNPEYGEFKVITVQFDGHEQGKRRSFVAELQAPHKLSFPEEVSWEDLIALSPEDLYDRFGALVVTKLEKRLQQDPRFAHFRKQWLPTDMLADLHIGYVNIAEAMIDVQGRSLQPRGLLVELDLPEEIPDVIKVFSLNRVLSQDSRFVDVGDSQDVIWSLRRWQPEEALVVPSRLRYEAVTYNRTTLDVTHLQLEREIDDELSELIAPPNAASARSTTVLLGYSHWRVGSLPLTGRTQILFPDGSPEQRTLITFVDQANQAEFPGWVVHAHRFVYGLADWYRSNDIPVGAYVKLERTEDPHRIAVDFIPRRMQREWAPMAYRNDEGELAFQMQKRPIACEYDALCLLDELDQAVIDQLWQQEQERNRPLEKVIEDAFLALAKVNPNGMVHAKTAYVGTNVLRRCPPGLVFATLFGLTQFLTTGDGYWVYQEHAGLR
jgi:hypothetical protein